ncbi:MAG: pyrimidine/purine nucleoside phosphorylase, partial [Candidatus Eremiobacteraeota bacterium]|nr:pyrimidine/purine nucleoside phosphorylase [Candidatus Eremiobacteraeota bacterium]
MEHNVYYEGKVQSLGFQSDRGEATVGVCEPGTYVVPTDTEEHLTFLSGRGRYK